MHASACAPTMLVSALAMLVGVGVHEARADPLLFAEATSRLGAPQPCFDPARPDAEGCYSHAALMVDLDGDLALDVLFANGGGYFTPSAAAPLALYVNRGGGAFVESNARLLGGFRGRVQQVAVGDVDGDGDLDVYAPDAYGAQPDALFVNAGAPSFALTDEGPARVPFASRAGAARFGDVDGDGDVDLVVADWGAQPPATPGTVRVYANDGRGFFRERAGAVAPDASAGASGPVDVDLFDANGDFALDLLVADRVGPALLFLGDGAGAFTRAPLPAQHGPYVYGPDECDVDGDGDLDIWLDNGARGDTEQLLVNDGHGHFTDETDARVSGNPMFVDDNVVRCADVNGDGALDAVIGSVSGDRRVLVNDGTGHFTLYAGAFPAQRISTLGLDVGDVDGDGRLDVVTAQGESGPQLNRLYLATSAVPPDTRAPVVRAIERLADGAPAGDAVVRFAVSDSATTDTGPRLRGATIELGDAPAAFPARFIGGDLFRATVRLPAGRVAYRACAVDWAGNRGCGAWTTVRAAGGAGAVISASGGCATARARGGRGAWLAVGCALLALFARARRRARR